MFTQHLQAAFLLTGYAAVTSHAGVGAAAAAGLAGEAGMAWCTSAGLGLGMAWRSLGTAASVVGYQLVCCISLSATVSLVPLVAGCNK